MNQKIDCPCTNCIVFSVCKSQIIEIFRENRGKYKNSPTATYWAASYFELTDKCSLIKEYEPQECRNKSMDNTLIKKMMIEIFGDSKGEPK